LIYFTAEARARLFAQFAKLLRPRGVLFVGATEALALTHGLDLRPVSFGFYVREDERSSP
jgi:chemotaxis methyl-accepting protein methylase